MTGGDLPLMRPKVEDKNFFYRFSSTFVLLNPLQINPFLFISPIFTHLYSFSSTIIQFHSYHPRSSILIHIIVKQLCSILIPFFVIVESLLFRHPHPPLHCPRPNHLNSIFYFSTCSTCSSLLCLLLLCAVLGQL